MKPANQGVGLKHKETRAWHAGCPVNGGTKFAANFWFQNKHPVRCHSVQHSPAQPSPAQPSPARSRLCSARLSQRVLGAIFQERP